MRRTERSPAPLRSKGSRFSRTKSKPRRKRLRSRSRARRKRRSARGPRRPDPCARESCGDRVGFDALHTRRAAVGDSGHQVGRPHSGSIAQGIVTEVYYPRIDIPQIKDLGFIIADDKGFWVELRRLDNYTVSLPAPGVPAAEIIHRHPRFTFHFTPTSCSWLNAVEGFFAKLSKRRLKRGVFHSLVDLQAAINRFLAEHNLQPKPFVWTANPDCIIAAVKRGHQALDSIH